MAAPFLARRFAAGFFAAALMFGLSACQSLSSVFREPLLSLRSVEIAGVNFEGVNLLCKINVENPNAIEIPFPEVDWELFINANSFIKGIVKNDNPLKARKTTVVDVPVSLDYLGVFNTFKSLRGSKEADYRVALGAKFSLPLLGDKVWRFEHEGVLPVIQIPRLARPSVKFNKIDFTGAEMSFRVEIENPNSFEIPFPKMNYDYSVNKNSFIKSSVAAPAALAAGAATPVDIQFRVVYTDLYRTFQALRNTAEVPSLLALTGSFPVPAFSGETALLEIPASLPLLKAPNLSFKGISVKNMGLAAIDFEINWELENTNNFAMNIKELAYNIAVNNSRWAEGRLPSAPVIGPNKKTLIPLVVSVNSLAMVKDLTALIARGSSVAYACGGSLNLGGELPGLDDFTLPFNFSGSTRISK
jgi:LEA14-like dessication related protein